jgi:hypothetical protein
MPNFHYVDLKTKCPGHRLNLAHSRTLAGLSALIGWWAFSGELSNHKSTEAAAVRIKRVRRCRSNSSSACSRGPDFRSSVRGGVDGVRRLPP